MLQNAVLLVSKLSQIRDINDNLVAVGSLPLDYTTYSDMHILACNQLDKDLKVPRNSKSKRTVSYSHFKEDDYFEKGYLDAGDEFFSNDVEQQDQRDISLHQAWAVLRMSPERECHSFQRTFGTRSPKPYASTFERIGTQISAEGTPTYHPTAVHHLGNLTTGTKDV